MSQLRRIKTLVQASFRRRPPELAWWLPAWLDRIVPNITLEGQLVANSDSMGKPVAGRPAADPARA
jgi:hypothetical protein